MQTAVVMAAAGVVQVSAQEQEGAGRDTRIDIDDQGWFWLRTTGKTERLTCGGNSAVVAPR